MTAWPDVGEKVGLEVKNGRADRGIVFCWTRTGVTIAANKVPGVRAALCWDGNREGHAHVGRCQRFSDESPEHVYCRSERDTGFLVFEQCGYDWN
jgi:hypothetical protein